MTTATRLAQHLVDHILHPWPGGSLLTPPIARALADTIGRVHQLTCTMVGQTVPMDRWLGIVVGATDNQLSGDDLARFVADRLIAIVERVTTAPAKLAVTGLPPPSGNVPSPVPSLPGFPPFPGRWDPPTVRRALLSLGPIGAAELSTLGPRLAVATTLAEAAVALPGVRSTLLVGSTVHPILQDRYRSSYSPPNLVVADRQATGGAQNYNRTPLAQAAATGPASLGALYLAWLNTRWMSSRRSDLTDLSRLANWEIKPLLSAPTGVLQEAWYRCAYNWVATNLEATNPALVGQFGWLLPGPPWESSLLRSIPLSPIGGAAAAAIPYTTMALPGIVLYAVVSGPTMIDIAIFVALLLRLLEDEIKRQLETAAAAVRAILTLLATVLDAISKWISENLVMIITVIVVAGLVAAAVAAGIAAAPAFLAVGTAAAVLFIIDRFGAGSTPGERQSADAPTTITLDFAGVSVRLPTRDAGKFCLALEPIAASAFGRLAEELGRRTQTVA